MQFLKKHYEKILLSVVLLGLAAASAALPLMVSQARDQIETTVGSVVGSKPKPWIALDLGTNQKSFTASKVRFEFNLPEDIMSLTRSNG